MLISTCSIDLPHQAANAPGVMIKCMSSSGGPMFGYVVRTDWHLDPFNYAQYRPSDPDSPLFGSMWKAIHPDAWDTLTAKEIHDRRHQCATKNVVGYPSPCLIFPAMPNNGYCTVCFPPTAKVTKLLPGFAGQEAVQVDVATLAAGDVILAADARTGTLRYDTVSLMSMAAPRKEATFVVLTTRATSASDGDEQAALAMSLTLTPGHHVATGRVCCSSLKRAANIAVGDIVWAVSTPGSNGTLSPRTVVAKRAAIHTGAYSPVLVEGGLPIVDGMATSFDSLPQVELSARATPWLEWQERLLAPRWRLGRVGVELLKCSALFEWLNGALGGETAAGPFCRRAEFIDGLVIDAPALVASIASWLSGGAFAGVAGALCAIVASVSIGKAKAGITARAKANAPRV